MKFAALGRTAWLYDAIQAVTAAGHELVLIGTCPASNHYNVTERDFELLAAQHQCRFFCDPKINQPRYVEALQASEAAVAISVNWLTLMRHSILTSLPHGILNAHCGDLPRYRGNACPNWAIIQQERQVVLTVHRMTEELDAGPILLQRAFSIDDATYIDDIYCFMSQSIPQMFVEAIDGLATNSSTPRPQSSAPEKALRCLPRQPKDSEIRWEHSARALASLVRASAEPFGGAYTFFQGQRLVIWRARAEPLPHPMLGTPGQVARIRSNGEVAVITGDGLLILQQVEYGESGRTQAKAVIRSIYDRLGFDVSGELLALRRRVEQLEAIFSRRQATA